MRKKIRKWELQKMIDRCRRNLDFFFFMEKRNGSLRAQGVPRRLLID